MPACPHVAMSPVGPKLGTEKLALDLSKVPTVQQGLDDAAKRDRGFIEIAKKEFNFSRLSLDSPNMTAPARCAFRFRDSANHRDRMLRASTRP